MNEPISPAAGPLTDAVLELVLYIPDSAEPMGDDPVTRAQIIARNAARNASLLSGSLALPPGVLGWLTVVPELVGVWKIQAQMVADISAVYGKRTSLGHEHMLYCLFKHISAHVFRDVVVRVGERVVVRETALKFLQMEAQKLGILISKTMLRKSVTRFVPMIGALSVGAFAYFDTLEVAKTAVELFERDCIIEADVVRAY